MINLIRNELSKVFHKKSIYIMLIVTLIFIIACNVIYKYKDDDIKYGVSYQIEYYEETLKNLNPNNENDVDMYIQAKTEIETAKLIQNYGDKYNWQMRVINSFMRDVIRQMNEYLYREKDTAKYEETKKEYEMLVAKINSGDWKYFVQTELEEVQKNLEQAKKENLEQQIYSLELQEQVLKWRLEKNICYGNDYKNECLESWENGKRRIKELKEENLSSHSYNISYNRAMEQIEISKYDIENEKTSGLDSDARGLLLNIFDQFELFIIIMGIMIAGTIVSEEFNKGTIKLLLIKPYKRTTILTAKFISSIIVLLIVIIIVMLMQFLVGGIVQGFELFKTPAVVYNHNIGQIQEISIPNYLLMQTLGKLPMYILLMTLAFALSTLFTNSALAITIGVLGYIGGPLVNQLAIAYNLKWIKYFVTPNWDLRQYLYGGVPQFEGINFAFSIAIIICYMIIMLVPTYMVFKRRNIKNI